MCDKWKKGPPHLIHLNFLNDGKNTAIVSDSGNSTNDIKISSNSNAKVHSSVEAEVEQDF